MFPIVPLFATVNSVEPGYFETESIPILKGRDFTDADRRDALPVAIVNETMARHYWPNEDALGKRFRFFTVSGAGPENGRSVNLGRL
jgi:MacB-like periplasmic core domain